MPSPLYIALRFIGHRKKAIILSLGGIILGVAFFICTQAQTQGFERFYIQTVLGTTGSIIVQDRFQERYAGMLRDDKKALISVKNEQPRKYYEGITDADEVMRVLREFSNVLACAPVLEGSATVETDFQSEVFRLQGIDLDAQLQATDLHNYMISGDLGDFRPEVSGTAPRFAAGAEDGRSGGQHGLHYRAGRRHPQLRGLRYFSHRRQPD